jgi:uncharacterized protein
MGIALRSCGGTVTPLSSFVFKVASRCNLDCTYCYEYNMGDDSWRTQPKAMSAETARIGARRLLEHCRAHGFDNLTISLHGGEPLAIGPAKLSAIVRAIKEELEPYCRLHLGLQTNGTLLGAEMLALLEEERVSIGISFDGPPELNDSVRIYKNGRGSSVKVIQALERLRGSPSFAGMLAVIHIHSDPIKVWRFLAAFDPPSLDFLFPHGNWEILPLGKTRHNKPYAEWLIPIFDDWFGSYRSDIRIRFFEEIIVRLLGGKGALESLGLEPVALGVIGADGSYEAVDTLKSAFPGAHLLNMHIKTHSLDEVLAHPSVAMRQQGLSALSETCRQCAVVRICGGGYLPHRFSKANGFKNPSIFCNDIGTLIDHISLRVRSARRNLV